MPETLVGGRSSGLAALGGRRANDPNIIAAANFCHGFLISTGKFHAKITQRGVRAKPMLCLCGHRPDPRRVSSGYVALLEANESWRFKNRA